MDLPAVDRGSFRIASRMVGDEDAFFLDRWGKTLRQELPLMSLINPPNVRTVSGLLTAFIGIPCSLLSPLSAERTSTTYAIVAEATGQSGGTIAGTGIVLASTIGGEGQIATGSGATVDKSGFVGQLYDPVQLNLSSDPASYTEGSSFQLQATASMDDDSLLALAPGTVNWSIVEGPVSSISSSGLATLGIVFTTTPAAISGSSLGVTGQLGFNVINSDPDNFGSYGGDGLDDSWQITYFGAPPNAEAGPSRNPDGDPHDNAFEFLTGFNPNDPGDFLRFSIIAAGEGTASFRLNKVISGRTYHLRKGSDLDAFPTVVSSQSPVSEESDYIIQDPTFSGTGSFYQIEITRP